MEFNSAPCLHRLINTTAFHSDLKWIKYRKYLHLRISFRALNLVWEASSFQRPNEYLIAANCLLFLLSLCVFSLWNTTPHWTKRMYGCQNILSSGLHCKKTITWSEPKLQRQTTMIFFPTMSILGSKTLFNSTVRNSTILKLCKLSLWNN